MPVLRGFPSQNVVAVFNEPNTSGAIDNFNAGRNAPARLPGSNIVNTIWHSDFFQYELAMPIQSVTIEHPAIAGRQIYWGFEQAYNGSNPNAPEQIRYLVPGSVGTTNHTLIEHNLGYVPLAFVAWGGRMIMPGVPVQTATQGRSRFVAPYITTSTIFLREIRNSSANTLSAVSRTYSIIIFRVPAIQATRALFGKEGNNVVLGRGKIDTSKTYLRRTGAGASPFDIDLGRTIDLNNGRSRLVSGGNTITEDGYGGSFTGPSYIPVGV